MKINFSATKIGKLFVEDLVNEFNVAGDEHRQVTFIIPYKKEILKMLSCVLRNSFEILASYPYVLPYSFVHSTNVIPWPFNIVIKGLIKSKQNRIYKIKTNTFLLSSLTFP